MNTKTNRVLLNCQNPAKLLHPTFTAIFHFLRKKFSANHNLVESKNHDGLFIREKQIFINFQKTEISFRKRISPKTERIF